MAERLRVGLIVNPVAGVGGPAALRGSDGLPLQREAALRGATSAAQDRARRALAACRAVHERLLVVTWGASMGEDATRGFALTTRVLGSSPTPTTALDTRDAISRMVEAGIDLLLFVGGDGTARDVLASTPPLLPVLGVPAGVKMRSGVFTVTPEDAGAVIVRLVEGGLVAADVAEVQDVEDVEPVTYGEMRVPRIGGYLQHLKAGGREVEELVLTEIAAWVAGRLIDRGVALIGPGSTTFAIKRKLGIEGTLLGVDAIEGARLLARDADARTLESIATPDSVLVTSFTRQQGFLFGRGNQQLSATVLKRISRDNLWVVGSRTKLDSLAGRPLRVDTGDAGLDKALRGVIEVVTGYDDVCYHRIG